MTAGRLELSWCMTGWVRTQGVIARRAPSGRNALRPPPAVGFGEVPVAPSAAWPSPPVECNEEGPASPPVAGSRLWTASAPTPQKTCTLARQLQSASSSSHSSASLRRRRTAPRVMGLEYDSTVALGAGGTRARRKLINRCRVSAFSADACAWSGTSSKQKRRPALCAWTTSRKLTMSHTRRNHQQMKVHTRSSTTASPLSLPSKPSICWCRGMHPAELVRLLTCRIQWTLHVHVHVHVCLYTI